MLTRLAEFIICRVLCARWIVSESEDSGEMGLRICGVNLWYYKWSDPMVTTGQERIWRFARKNEFGRTVKATRMSPEDEATQSSWPLSKTY